MPSTIIARYGELALKSEPVRRRFEISLIRSMRRVLGDLKFEIRVERGRIFVETGSVAMAMKRLAELRHIRDRAALGAYRKSFRYYTEERLLVSILFYASACALFGGIFIVRYRLELILFVPLLAGFMAYYFKIGMQPDSAAQHPERLHHERGFVLYTAACLAAFVLLMFTSIPALYQWFRVEPANITPLWTIGPGLR